MTPPAPVATEDWPRPASAWWTVGVLLVAYTFSYVDRSILTILVEPIQADLHINDTQLSLLHGFAFVIFYVTLGVPLGYLADRARRTRLVAGSIALWSLMTAACGLTSTFGQLFGARIGVGIGEAGLSPAAYSLIADCFPPQRRSMALGLYAVGIYLGSGLAILGGGLVIGLVGAQPMVHLPLLGAVRSWQLVFFIVGLPGLLVAALAASLREPSRKLQRSELAHEGLRAEWAKIWSHIGAHGRAYGLITLGFAFLGVPFNVAVLWARPYLSRHFGMTPSHGAYLVGALMLVCATAGIVVGSLVCDRLQARRPDATVRIGLVAAFLVLPPVVLFPLAPTVPLAAAALGALLFFGAFAYGAAPASLQLITPNRMRASVSALYLVLVNLVGLTAGPLITGALTDYVFHDKAAVGTSAAIVGVGGALVAALAFALLLKPFARAVQAQADALAAN
ncbi:MFS transporter [Phenylobacterium aquaticum]|uniref:spinster family MFS transporter n=1 Tax=Phenylobacterium aquaticum TaxID=1763816 RepID=UPI0026F23CD0|nr:MFS transporter [Phenylobacterium aquaticum]